MKVFFFPYNNLFIIILYKNSPFVKYDKLFTYVLSQIIYECVLIDDATYNFKASFYNQTKENRMTSCLKAFKYSSDGAV